MLYDIDLFDTKGPIYVQIQTVILQHKKILVK